MRIWICALLSFAGLLGSPAAGRADFSLRLDGVPAMITPGADFSFDVILNGPVTFDGYQIVLTATASSGTNNAFQFLFDNDPDATNTFTPSVGYFVPPQDSNFGATSQPFSGDDFTNLFISDYGLNPNSPQENMTYTAGDKLIERVTVRTAAEFVGNLTFTFNTTRLYLLDNNNSNVPGVEGLRAQAAGVQIRVEGPPAPSGVAVPLPPTLVVALAAGAGVAGVARRRRGAA